MNNSLVYKAGRGTTFSIEGNFVEITTDTTPVARVIFTDLLEFAKKHPLTAQDAPERQHTEKITDKCESIV